MQIITIPFQRILLISSSSRIGHQPSKTVSSFYLASRSHPQHEQRILHQRICLIPTGAWRI